MTKKEKPEARLRRIKVVMSEEAIAKLACAAEAERRSVQVLAGMIIEAELARREARP